MDNKDKKYVVNIDISNDGKEKKTIQLNIVNKSKTSKEKNISNTTTVKSESKLFFGWENIKWFISEIGKMYSPEPSYFSKKRFESSIAFIIAQWGMILYLLNNYERLSMADFLLWVSVEFVISGYYVNHLQKEKKDRGYKTDSDQIYTYNIQDNDSK